MRWLLDPIIKFFYIILLAQGIADVFDWGIGCFKEPLDRIWDVVKWVTSHHKTLAIFRALGAALEDKPAGGCELLKFCDTRFASRIRMAIRYKSLLPLLKMLVADPKYVVWLAAQSAPTREKGAEIQLIIQSLDVARGLEAVIAVMEPAMRLLRLTDGKSGATLGKVYGYMLQLDELYRGA
jgi:hypothetical protein